MSLFPSSDPGARDPAFGNAPTLGTVPAVEAVPIAAADAQLIGGPCRYFGFSVYNDHATNYGEMTLYSGSGTGGVQLERVSLAPLESRAEWYGPGGIAANGIYLDVNGGNINGSLRVWAE